MSKLFRILLLFLVLTGVGIGWFVGIEQWPLVDAIYITVITLTTVGFSEVRSPLEARTKLFLAFYLIASVGIFMYGAFQLGEVLIRAELADWWRKRNMDQERKALEQHYIVCGCGRMGQMLCQQLAESKLPFVAIDRDPDVLEICRHNGWPYVQGDASDDRTLLEAGIERARGLATVLTSDADNLYVVLSSKLLSKQIRVIARATDAKGVAKMEKAGADQVVSLYASGAMRMAQLLTHPTLGDFYEIVSTGGIKLDLAEIHVAPSASFAGQTLADTDFRQRGILVMGICKADGQVLFPPPASTMIDAGDNLFALGDANAIQQLTLDDQDSRIRGTRIEI